MNVNEIKNAIAAHAMWKIRLQDAIASGASDVDHARASDCHACEFGRWFATVSPLERNSPHGRTVAEMHAKFHAEAARVLSLALQR